MKKSKQNIILLSIGLLWSHGAFAQHGHEHDPTPIQGEHQALLDLVKHEDATDMAINSGDWLSERTWMHGRIPGEGSRVMIPEGIEVVVSEVMPTVHKTIRVDGSLVFATNRNTALRVDTLVVSPVGYLEMGTEQNPVQAGFKAKIQIADTGEIDIDWDPNELSRGLLSHGTVIMHGEVKTGNVDLAVAPQKGDTALILAEAPVNWKAGDVLVVPGTHTSRDRDEVVVIDRIDGTAVNVLGLSDTGAADSTWRGFQYDHDLTAGVLPFVMNVSRNVVIESENVFHFDESGINRRRGHVMFMHSGVGNTDTRYVGAYGLGRTDKRTPLESPEFDDHGNRIADTGHNVPGRYAWHYHRGDPTSHHPAIAIGLAIVDSPGLGLVNHSSNVEVSDSVAYDVVGSAWFTEAGDEIGFFNNVAAIRMTGSGEGTESRRGDKGGVITETDFGHSGHGFWLQGGGVTLADVKVAGAGNAAIIFFTVPLDEAGIGKARFQASLLPDPSIANGKETVGVGTVPFELDGGIVFGNSRGVATKFHQLGSRHNVTSLIEDMTAVNNKTALSIPYTNQLVVNACNFIGNPDKPSRSKMMKRNKVTRNIQFMDVTAQGWGHGVDMPVRGTNRVIGGTYQNVKDILIGTTKDDDRLISIEGRVSFLDLTDEQLSSYYRGKEPNQKYQIYLSTKFESKMKDLTQVFKRDIIRLATLVYEDHQLFYHAQAADFVPYPTGSAPDYVPAEILDKSNSQLWDTYGLAVGDAMAPGDAFMDRVIHGLVGRPIEYAPKVKIRSRAYTNDLTEYMLCFNIYNDDGSKTKVKERETYDLREDWNFLTVEVDGFLRTFLVFGDITPPEFVINSKIDLIINPSDLKKGFVVAGKILDNSFGEKKFKKKFKGKDLLKLPIQTTVEGINFVLLEFEVSDLAKNKTPVSVAIVLDENEPTAAKKRRKKLKSRTVSTALLHLLGLPNGNTVNS